jgi:tRNA modification GTPase
MPANETIVAVSTPSGRGALAILRISGPEACSITAKCLKEIALFEKAEARYVGLYTVINPSSLKTIDQVTIIKYPAPRSYTGENMVEIISHGGKLIVHELLDAFKAAGARGAERGEFTRRALVNGKIDLLKAEAIQGIIESESQVDLACARKLYYGESVLFFSHWREELISLLEGIEAWIEFEEEEGMRDREAGRGKLDRFISVLSEDLQKRERIKIIDGGLKVVIAGPANAGKSTLFNQLLGFDRTIVHSAPGTTRDMISERIMMGDSEILLIDSAGIREAENEIERKGIERSREAILSASIVVWVTAADEKLSETELEEIEKKRGFPMLCIINKVDKSDGTEKKRAFNQAGIQNIAVSLWKQDRIKGIESTLKAMVEKIHDETEVPDIIFNNRHEEIARSLFEEIKEVRNAWDQAEIAAMHLKGAIAYLDEFFGKADPETIMNKIFENFCIGK